MTEKPILEEVFDRIRAWFNPVEVEEAATATYEEQRMRELEAQQAATEQPPASDGASYPKEPIRDREAPPTTLTTRDTTTLPRNRAGYNERIERSVS